MTERPKAMIVVGPNVGGRVQNEDELRAKLAAGYDVFFVKNGVCFQFTLEDDKPRYTALSERPAGL